MKNILITGSTDGIGKLTAKNLAREGHKLILHGRNHDKLQNTISELKELTKNEQISGVVSDLADFDSLLKMIDDIVNTYSVIDVLINNAGVYHSSTSQNKNHLDMRFAVNYFAPIILTHGILDLLKKSPSPRVINLSSAAQSSVSIEALSGIEQISPQNAYAQSKLALTMWSFYFASKHPDICTIAVNPGSLLNTKMVKEAFGQHWDSAEKGAQILCDLANSEAYGKRTGEYFDNDKGAFNKAHNDAYRPEKISELIAKSAEILRGYVRF